MTVKIYEVTQTAGIFQKSYGNYSVDYRTSYSLEQGGDDGVDYLLPAGYTLGEDAAGMKHIYTDSGVFCELITFGHTPAIIDPTKPINESQILLKKA